MSYREIYTQWCTDDYFDSDTKRELLDLQENEMEDRFYKDLEFGTGGLRGVLGAGTNRMNVYTVRKATQGLANYILKKHGQEKGVAIAYDSRMMSDVFSEEAALCLNANGIKSYRFDSLRPTPELSFAVRRLGCIAGIVITASHNPAEYNGYKVYWEDGAQVTAPFDREIMEEVTDVKSFREVKMTDRQTAEASGLYHTIGAELDERYLEELLKLILEPEAVKEMAGELKIVYTPLHGAGCHLVKSVLQTLGFNQLYIVEEQEKPDGRFPTVISPNPEQKEAFGMALQLAEKADADLVLATDPDADRLGVYIKGDKQGEYHALTGNMTGVLLCEYLLNRRQAQGQLPENGAVVKTIVTTNMIDEIAKIYGVQVFEVLTGFKYIGEKIKEFEEEGSYTFLFGFEESYGCLAGSYARDKDAIGAAAALCEAAAFYKKQGMTLWEKLCSLYETYGYFEESLKTVTLKGKNGAKEIRKQMKELRSLPPAELDGKQVLAVRDYKSGEIRNCKTGELYATGLPLSDVLYFELEDECWQCIRPSGTEPKIKYYYGRRGNRQ